MSSISTTPSASSGRPASIGIGCVKLGGAAAGGARAGVRLVHEALDCGVSMFDTADVYGNGASERVLGRALRRRRERATIATKAGYVFRERSAAELRARRWASPAVTRFATRGGRQPAPAGGRAYEAKCFTPSHLRRALEASLRRLATDHVDLFQLHGPALPCDDDVLALAEDLRRKGKIGALGIGLERIGGAETWLGRPGVTSLQLPFGVLDPEAGASLVPAASERGVAVIARGVFAAGLLGEIPVELEGELRPAQRPLRVAVRAAALAHGVDPLAFAAWFARSQPGVTTVLIGTSSSAHLRANLAHFAAPPPPEDLVAAVDAVLETYRRATRCEAGGDV